MADPVKPDIDYSYTGFQQATQDRPFPGSQLDNDLAELKRAADDTIDALADVRRADGKLNNKIVTTDSLADGVLVGVEPPAAWATATAYFPPATVTNGSGMYRCVEQHVSGVFATDLTAGKWELIFTLQQGPKGDTGDVGPQGERGPAGADGSDATVTATNVAAAGAVMAAATDASSFGFVLDEDDMASDSDIKVPTQQSVKAYVDANASGSVADRTALKALNTTSHKTAYLREAGREGTFIWNSSDLSAEVTADTQEGIYVAPTSDATGASGAWVRTLGSVVAPVASPAIRTIESKLWDRADLRDWNGLDLTGANDCTSLVNAAIADSGVTTLWVPKGIIALTDMVTLPSNKSMVGENVIDTVFSIDASFNMAALGVLKVSAASASESVGIIDKIGFEFEQPATGARADMNQYPPVINHNNIYRVRIGHVRFSAAWDGIDAGGNTGGSKYDFVECGTLHRGLLIDGALDTVDVGYFKVWPWGIGASGDGGTGDVYRDESNIGAEIGRCDGLEGKLALFQAGLLLNANATAGGGTPRHLDAVHLDSGGAWLKCQSGQMDIDYLYMTRNPGPTTPGISGEAGILRISEIHVANGSSMDVIQVADGATVAINGGRIQNLATAGRIGYLGTGTGTLKIRNTELVLPGARAVPAILADGGTLIVQNNDVPNDGGTGDFINVTGGGPTRGRVGGNELNGRKLNLLLSLIGRVDQRIAGYISADGATTVRIPTGCSVTKVGTGDYAISHSLGWPQSRQAITITPQNNSTDASAVVDQANTTTTGLRVKTYSAGVAADLPFTFVIAHT